MKSDFDRGPAFIKGKTDYSVGIPAKRCPFPLGSRHRDHWMRGWKAAKLEDRTLAAGPKGGQ